MTSAAIVLGSHPMTPIQEIIQALRVKIRHDPAYKAFREKTTKLAVLGLRVPVIHEIVRSNFSFYQKSPRELIAIWNRIWTSSCINEVLLIPLLYYRRHLHLLDPAHWRVLKTWINRVDNWEHADALCALYSIFFERYPRLVQPTLKEWNQSSNAWERRASIVSMIYYASTKRIAPTFRTVISLIEPLIGDQDRYVQKAIGWQLRELHKLYPAQTLSLLLQHARELSPTSFSYATERLTQKEKERIKKKRMGHHLST